MADPISFEDFMASKPKPPKELLRKVEGSVTIGVLHENSKGLLYGPKKLGKSIIVNQLAFAMRSGTDWLGFKTEQSSVMMVQTEVSDAMLWKRLDKMTSNLPPSQQPDPYTLWLEPSLKIDSDVGRNALYRWLEKFTPRLVILDPLYKLISRPGDPDVVLQFQDIIDVAIKTYNASFLIVAHPRKPSADKPVSEHSTDDFYGPGWYTNWTDVTLKFGNRLDKPVDYRILQVEDTRNSEGVVPNTHLRFNRQTLLFEETIPL